MKKFFHVFLSVLFVSLATGLVSCDKDDDEVAKKPEPDPEPIVETVRVYTTFISESVFDLYDVKLLLHSGDKSKEIALKKSNCTLVDFEYLGGTTKLCSYNCDGFDGIRGITRVEGFVTINDNTEALINAMDDDSKIFFFAGASINEAVYSAEGDYSSADMTGFAADIVTSKKELLETNSAGKTFYQRLAETCSTTLGAE